MTPRPMLILGTAQWGLDYGITNLSGRLTDAAIDAIVKALPDLGITILDTAPAYGDAETRIAVHAPAMTVQTKVSAAGDLEGSVLKSAELLGRAPDRVIVHDWASLDAERQRAAARILEGMRGEGMVSSVGISGYAEPDLVSALGAFERLDVAQLPVSILDQRLVDSSAVAALRSGGGRFQARSVYLQGLALSAAGTGILADHPALVALRAKCDQLGVSPGSACRSYVLNQAWIDEVVIGVTSVDELVDWAHPVPELNAEWVGLASEDLDLIDPRRWPPVPAGG